jgi:hypothetical protein
MYSLILEGFSQDSLKSLAAFAHPSGGSAISFSRRRGSDRGEVNPMTKKPPRIDRRDTLDDEAQDHVWEFIRTFGEGIRLEKISLKTPDSARSALQTLEKIQTEISRKQNLALKLRGIFKNP